MLHQATMVLRLCPLCTRRNVQIQWYFSRWFYYLGYTWPSSPESANGKAIACPIHTINLRPSASSQNTLKIPGIDNDRS